MGTIWLLRRTGHPGGIFVKQLGFSQEQAFVTFGAFAALVYGLISIGGYVGDHLLGTKRTLVLGAIVLAIGYFMTGMSLLKPDLIFIALGTIAVGNGLFKANPASLLSKCYPPKTPVWTVLSPCFICRLTSVRCCHCRCAGDCR